jgi:phage terminase large subunit-like protein
MSTLDSWIKTASDQAAWDQGCRPDLKAADRVRQFFARFLRHSVGQFAGKPFELLPWQWDDVIRPLFGWKRADGSRRFRLADIFIPKKNGKSTLAAALQLYMLVGDSEPGAECYCAASDREQASIVFRECARMVRASETLDARLKVRDSTKYIRYPAQNGFIRALSADVGTKEGLNAHCVIVDELHVHKSPELYWTLRYAGAARRQPLTFTISTAGEKPEDTDLCYQRYKHAKAILSGDLVDTGCLAVVYESAADKEWTDLAEWRKANPSMGHTISEADFAQNVEEAKHSAAERQKLLRYRLNRWVSSSVKWIESPVWSACGREDYQPTAKSCYAALDLSSTQDITALSLVFPEPGGLFALRTYYWVPQGAIKKRERLNKQRYEPWARAGRLTLIPGDVVEYDPIVDFIAALPWKIEEIGIDRWNSSHVAAKLQEKRFKVTGIGQGYLSLSGPTREFEKLLLSGKLIHDNCPVTAWMVDNCSVEMDAAGNMKPSKKKSRDKIDGVMSTVMALALAIVKQRKVSIYQGKSLQVIDCKNSGYTSERAAQ